MLTVGLFLGYKLAQYAGSKPSSQHPYPLDAVVELIQDNYVDSVSVSRLYEGGVEGILQSLDPHTVFISKNELPEANEELEGHFYGIGIEFYQLNDTVRVSYIIPKGPSETSNLKPGDRILKIDNRWVAGKKMDTDSIVALMKGKRNVPVRLEMMKPNGTRYQETLTRGEVKLPSIPAYYLLTSDIGYIGIDVFSETTAEEFRHALQDLIQQGMNTLILDVRNNPGGYMDAVTAVADELIPGKELLLKTKGNHSWSEVYTSGKGLFETKSVTVLINEGSASASEILAGIMQDLDRGTVMGRRSFGKGLVQEQFSLPDGSAIRLTTARYYLPSGRCIQKDYSKGREEYDEEIWARMGRQEDSVQSEISKDKTVFFTRKKRPIKGNSGIHPDVYLPIDSSVQESWYNFRSTRTLEEFVFQYLQDHPETLNVLGSLKTISEDEKKLDAMFKAFDENMKHQTTPFNLIHRVSAHRVILSLLAKQKFGKSGEERVLSVEDKELQKTIALLQLQ